MRMFLRVGSSNGVRKILGDFSSGVFAAFRLFSPRVLLFFFSWPTKSDTSNV